MLCCPVSVPGTCDSATAMSGILRGKCEEIDRSCSSVQESDDEVFSCDSADSVDSVNPSTSNHSLVSSRSCIAGCTPNCSVGLEFSYLSTDFYLPQSCCVCVFFIILDLFANIILFWLI